MVAQEGSQPMLVASSVLHRSRGCVDGSSWELLTTLNLPWVVCGHVQAPDPVINGSSGVRASTVLSRKALAHRGGKVTSSACSTTRRSTLPPLSVSSKHCTPHCTAPHRTALHCIALHCIAPPQPSALVSPSPSPAPSLVLSLSPSLSLILSLICLGALPRWQVH